MRRLSTTLLLFPLLAASSAAASCPVEKAQYRMMDVPAFSAGFRTIQKHQDWLSDIAFYIHSDESDRAFWFMFDQGSSAYIHLISTTDVTDPNWIPPPPDGGQRPLHDMNYFAADDSLHFSFEIPMTGDNAPAYVLVPELTSTMWYSADPRQSVPVAFFKLSACDG